jgi:hypothetical protein
MISEHGGKHSVIGKVENGDQELRQIGKEYIGNDGWITELKCKDIVCQNNVSFVDACSGMMKN